jgi:hypothetical protein
LKTGKFGEDTGRLFAAQFVFLTFKISIKKISFIMDNSNGEIEPQTWDFCRWILVKTPLGEIVHP